MTTLNTLFDLVNDLDNDTLLEERVFECYAPDAIFSDPVQTVRGRKAILKMYRDMLKVFPEIGATLINQVDNGNLACAEWEMTFKPKYWPATITLRGTSWLELDNKGLILRHQDYWDLWEFLRGGLPIQELLGERLPEPLKKLLGRDKA